MGIVYKVINTIDGKVYIGQTIKELHKRWRNHCCVHSSCTFLSRAIQKYGKENFEITIMARCNSYEEMNHREQYYIKLFNTLTPNGYNLTTGGENYKRSEESNKLISKRQSGRKLSAQTKLNISKAKKGKRIGYKQSQQTKLNISKAKKGRASLLRGRKRSEISIRKQFKAILCKETGIVYESITMAANQLKLNVGHISEVASGRRKSTGGLSFCYYGDDNNV